MEKLAIVHAHSGLPTGIALTRKEALTKREWCMCTNIFVLNSKGEVLCHQRSIEKERFPGMWYTHLGGHVGYDETYHSNAVKEVEEEIGLKINHSKIIPWRTTRKNDSRIWIREFVTISDVAIEELTPQPGEVEQFAWKTLEEIEIALIQEPNKWIAGTHNFRTEYYCMRAVLTAMDHKGIFEVSRDQQIWGHHHEE